LKLVYLLKESLRGFSTAKVSTLASVITIALSLILIAIYYAVSVNSSSIIQSVRDRVELEVFLQDNISQGNLDTLTEEIKRIGGIRSIKYISKEEAASIFTQEFGSEMLDILESNPLPPSFKINTYDEYKTIDRLEKIKEVIAQKPGVIEIYYPQENLKTIENTSSGILYLNLIILIVITLSSVFLVSNTVRLVIQSKRKVIQTLKLLGATNNFIRTPFLFEGIIQGFLAGILSIVLLVLLVQYYSSLTGQDQFDSGVFTFLNFFYLVIIGIILGLIGSSISIRKHLKENIIT
jgi:cell division transport system permease protein